MVKKEKGLYICEACGFGYASMEWAQKCEKWCNEHYSCNVEITKHAVQPH